MTGSVESLAALARSADLAVANRAVGDLEDLLGFGSQRDEAAEVIARLLRECRSYPERVFMRLVTSLTPQWRDYLPEHRALLEPAALDAVERIATGTAFVATGQLARRIGTSAAIRALAREADSSDEVRRYMAVDALSGVLRDAPDAGARAMVEDALQGSLNDALVDVRALASDVLRRSRG